MAVPTNTVRIVDIVDTRARIGHISPYIGLIHYHLFNHED